MSVLIQQGSGSASAPLLLSPTVTIRQDDCLELQIKADERVSPRLQVSLSRDMCVEQVVKLSMTLHSWNHPVSQGEVRLSLQFLMSRKETSIWLKSVKLLNKPCPLAG